MEKYSESNQNWCSHSEYRFFLYHGYISFIENIRKAFGESSIFLLYNYAYDITTGNYIFFKEMNFYQIFIFMSWDNLVHTYRTKTIIIKFNYNLCVQQQRILSYTKILLFIHTYTCTSFIFIDKKQNIIM